MTSDYLLAALVLPVVLYVAHGLGVGPFDARSLFVAFFIWAFLGPYRRYAFRNSTGSSCPWRDANRCEDTGGYDA